MINLEDWSDYQRSYNRLIVASNNYHHCDAPRLIREGVRYMVANGGFVKEDLPIAIRIAGIDAKTS